MLSGLSHYKSPHSRFSNKFSHFSTSEKKEHSSLYFSELTSHVTEMKINKPKTLNSLDYEMMNTAYNQLREWKRTKFPNVLLVSGTGGKAFCAGGDIVSLYNAKVKGENSELLQNLFAKYYIVDYALA